jgi:tRNA threonylcarbamoyladenosine biosynthesis protein TsaE
LEFGEALDEPMLIYLSGTLGAGKTRFVQAVAAGLGIDPGTVQSPTFTLMTPHTGRRTLVHVDAYRINDIDEVQQLGLDDWIQAGSIMMVEWAERIQSALPEPDLQVQIEHVNQTTRRFELCAETEIGLRHLSKCDSLFSARNAEVE